METTDHNSRRDFLQKLLASAVFSGLFPACKAPGAILQYPQAKYRLPFRPLGKTGHMVGICSLGGQGSIEVPGREELSAKIINSAVDLGINYIDTAAAYGRSTTEISQTEAIGHSERVIGEVMKARRREVFLASKTDDRSYDGAMRILEQSLKNLQTDYLDLWQIHNCRSAELDTIDKFFKDDGILKAMIRARDEKMIRFIGITGHESPAILKTLSERFPFDNVLVALNAADRHHDSFIEKFLPSAVAKGMGIVGMKIPARGRIFERGGVITIKEAMEYVMTLPVSTVIIGIDDISELEENIAIAKNFKPLSADQMLAIEERTRPYYRDLQFFKNFGEWPL